VKVRSEFFFDTRMGCMRNEQVVLGSVYLVEQFDTF
jgi:hypothetical protein